jgi:uncharacterized protein YndB with AHSA1/START domain
MSARSKPNEIRLTRVYDAPVQDVWEAWTDPVKVGKWWGPRGFTLTTKSKELKPGGKWIYTMHGPDGTDYPNIATYHEVVPMKRLVYDHGGNDERQKLFTVTATFSESGGKTTLDMTMTLETAEKATEVRGFIRQAGGNATWDRLAEFLADQKGRETFVIHRSFEAPIATVFEMWTKPEHLSRWLPPAGLRMEYLRQDIREGATTLFMMTNDAGLTLYGRATYMEITPPGRLVYTQQFCDKDENLSRHPMVPLWPPTMHTTVIFTAEGPGETRVKVEWQPTGEATREEVKAFVDMRPSMTGGWTGSFDKLENLLADQRR